MQITALRDDVVRVRVGPAGQLPEDASWAVLPSSRTATVNVTPESNGSAVGFKTAKLHVAVHKDPFGLSVTDNAGARDCAGFAGTADRVSRRFVSRVHEVAGGGALLRARRQAGAARSAQRSVHRLEYRCIRMAAVDRSDLQIDSVVHHVQQGRLRGDLFRQHLARELRLQQGISRRIFVRVGGGAAGFLYSLRSGAEESC